MYKTKVVDENSHEPKGLTAEKLEMHIRYSGLKHLFFAGMDNKELVPWDKRSVYFIVRNPTITNLTKQGVPVKEIVSKVLDTRIIGPEKELVFQVHCKNGRSWKLVRYKRFECFAYRFRQWQRCS